MNINKIRNRLEKKASFTINNKGIINSKKDSLAEDVIEALGKYTADSETNNLLKNIYESLRPELEPRETWYGTVDTHLNKTLRKVLDNKQFRARSKLILPALAALLTAHNF